MTTELAGVNAVAGLHALRSGDPVTRRLVAEAIDRVLDDGPALGQIDLESVTDDEPDPTGR
jgi:hypothetical protein